MPGALDFSLLLRSACRCLALDFCSFLRKHWISVIVFSPLYLACLSNFRYSKFRKSALQQDLVDWCLLWTLTWWRLWALWLWFGCDFWIELTDSSLGCFFSLWLLFSVFVVGTEIQAIGCCLLFSLNLGHWKCRGSCWKLSDSVFYFHHSGLLWSPYFYGSDEQVPNFLILLLQLCVAFCWQIKRLKLGITPMILCFFSLYSFIIYLSIWLGFHYWWHHANCFQYVPYHLILGRSRCVGKCPHFESIPFF